MRTNGRLLMDGTGKAAECGGGCRRPRMWLLVLLIGYTLAGHTVVSGDSNHSASDTIFSIDGQQVAVGELNLILGERFGVRQLPDAAIEVKQAAAAILVRRHLAMRSLRQQGGDKLADLIRSDYQRFQEDRKRSGSSVREYAEQRGADERSLEADLAWRTAWRTYLRSRMTDDNLRSYFRREHRRYDGGRWDVSHLFLSVDPSDQTSLTSATDRMKMLAAKVHAADSIEQAFAASAKRNSEAGSAPQGGRVGWVRYAGDLPHRLMRRVYRMKEGQVSEPIRSSLGVHLILLHQYEPGDLTFDELTDLSRLRRDATDMLFEALVNGNNDARVVWHLEQYRPPSTEEPMRGS